MYFWKKLDRLSSRGPEILAIGGYYSANFQPIFDCFIPNFKLKYEDSELMKIDRVSTVICSLNNIKHWNFFGDTLVHISANASLEITMALEGKHSEVSGKTCGNEKLQHFNRVNVKRWRPCVSRHYHSKCSGRNCRQ